MTIDINKFKEAIEFGSDIEFRYKNKNYTILPWTDEGIVIGLQNSDDDSKFKSADELIDNYTIDGNKMRDIIGDIEILLM
ncbi:MAG: hypothetical protein KH415_20240 [Clostridium sp.]|nr:hypothetical protein [Clostridium sp.]